MTNPILCDLPKSDVDIKLILSTGVEVSRTLIRSNFVKIAVAVLVGMVGFIAFKKLQDRARGFPQVIKGLPFLGKALDLQKNSKKVIVDGVQEYGASKSGVLRP